MTEFGVRHLAWLSRLKLSDEEERLLKDRLEAMRSLIDKLLEAPMEGQPLYHPGGVEGKLRDDEVQPGLKREEALANAAKTERGYVVAPRTVEE